MALEDPEFITLAAQEFGSQCIVVSIDSKKDNNEYYAYKNGGKDKSKYKLEDISRIVEDKGCGEILINSIERDGTGEGYDIEMINKVTTNVNVPVIACGGVSDWEDFAEALEETSVDAVAAANIFHYRDQSVFLAKKFLYDSKFNVRKPSLVKFNV